MSKESSSSSGGIGVLGVLGVVFVVLKLVGTIDWSWWYVTMPFWGGFACLIIAIVVYGFFCFIVSCMGAIKNKKP